jgi:hypothetical protein
MNPLSILQNFSIKNPRRVRGYLEKNPVLLPFLSEAGNMIKKFFKDSVDRISLEFSRDPETNQEYDFLQICVYTNLSLEDFKEFFQLHQWWFSVSPAVKKRLLIKIEFD